MNKSQAPAVSEETRAVYEALSHDLTVLSFRLQVYKTLFGSAPENVDLLNRIAPGTVWIIQGALGDSVAMGLARIVDPARTDRKPNLTLETLTERVEADGLTEVAADLRASLQELRDATKTIKHLRDKELAHTDHNSRLGRVARPSVSLKEIESAFQAVSKILNRFYGFSDHAEVAYQLADLGIGEPEELLVRLREAEAYRKEVPDWNLLGDPWRERIRESTVKIAQEEGKVTRLESLRRDIGRALIQAQFSLVGRDSTHQKKASGDAQHLLVPHFEQLPSELVQEMTDLTGGIIGLVLDPPQYRGTVTHIRELPDDWEHKVNRTILESFLLHLASACEWFIDEVKGNNSARELIESFPQHAQALKELRATRNCLLHNAGVVDSQYLHGAGRARRAKEGEILPLDWGYAYASTLLVLHFGKDVAKTP